MRPDECFRPCHIRETVNVENRAMHALFEANLYDSFLVTNPGWNIRRMLDKQVCVYVIRKKERIAQSKSDIHDFTNKRHISRLLIWKV